MTTDELMGEAKRLASLKKFFRIPIGRSAIGIFATTLAEGRLEVERVYRDGCDSECCVDRDKCSKEHYHMVNCHCVICQDRIDFEFD